MTLFGLTGGVGMGKTTASELLKDRGVSIIDTDEIARQLVQPGQPALFEIREAFGAEIIADDGTLRRGELAKKVFSSPEARRRLESILHPRIREVWLAQVETWRTEDRAFAAVIIPLLFETGASDHFNATLCVACTRQTQEGRLALRGWSGREIQERRTAQWPIENKMASADYVVWTEGSLEVHAAQLERILPQLERGC